MRGASPTSKTVIERRSEDSAEAVETTPGSSGTRHKLDRGALLDRYIILDPVAEGGMGAVYRAYDPRLHREVAVKLLKVESEDSDALRNARARLIREAQSMAQLSHPNVLPVFDVGSVDDRLFIAMEFVDGMNLRGWLREDRRDWREIVDVFVEAGRGLAAAHAAGVVHRDFKPGNVLLDRGDPPRVRVTDFGLARLSSGADDPEPTAPISKALSASALATPLTQHGVVVGTPPYMAPEQHKGKPADGRCDQYAFAVALWEAFYGARPFHAKSLDGLLASKLKGAPSAPKDRKLPAFVERVLRRALSPKPEDRFESVEAMVDSLRTEPTGSRWRYIALATVAGVAATATWGVNQLWASSDDPCGTADQEVEHVWGQQRRQAVADAFAGSGVPYANDAWARAEAGLTTWVEDWAASHRDACEATHVRHEQSALLLDRKMSCLQRRFARWSALVDILDGADAAIIRKAPDAVAALPGVEPCMDAEAMLSGVAPPRDAAVAKSVRERQSDLDRASAFHAAGMYDDALRVARDALDGARGLEYEPLEAEAQYVVGVSAMRAGDLDVAEHAFLESYFKGGAVGDHETAVYAALELSALAGMRSDSDLARRWGRHAQMQIDILGDRPALEARLLSALTFPDVIDERYEEGFAKIQRMLELADGVFGPNTPELASFNNQAGIFLGHLGRHQEAGEHFRRALQYREEAVGKTHPDVANLLINYGSHLEDVGETDAAAVVMSRAADIFRDAGWADHPNYGMVLRNLGTFRARAGKLDEAEPLFEEALAVSRSALGNDHPDVAAALYNLGSVARDAGRPADALPHFREAADVTERAFGSQDLRFASALLDWGLCASEAGDSPTADAQIDRALKIVDAVMTGDPAARTTALELVEDARDSSEAPLSRRFERWLSSPARTR